MQKKIKGAFVSKDCDNYVEVDKFPSDEFVVGLDITKTEQEINRLQAKSFCIVNDQNIFIDIVEKRICSEKICLGVYGFDSPEKFIAAYRSLTKDAKGDHTGIYLSHIISRLIGTGKSVYSYVETEAYEDWGTLDDWKKEQARYATYFLDIDGIILKNKGRYGKEHWGNSLPVLEENLKVVKRLHDNGAQIVSTSRDESSLVQFKKVLKKHGIKAHGFVPNCNHAPANYRERFRASESISELHSRERPAGRIARHLSS